MHLKQVFNPPFSKEKKGGQLDEKYSLNLKLHIEVTTLLATVSTKPLIHMFQIHNKSILHVSSKPETPQLD